MVELEGLIEKSYTDYLAHFVYDKYVKNTPHDELLQGVNNLKNTFIEHLIVELTQSLNEKVIKGVVSDYEQHDYNQLINKVPSSHPSKYFYNPFNDLSKITNGLISKDKNNKRLYINVIGYKEWYFKRFPDKAPEGFDRQRFRLFKKK